MNEEIQLIHWVSYIIVEISIILNVVCVYCHCSVTKLCSTLCNPIDCRPPGSSVHGISRQEYQKELSFPTLGGLQNPGIETASPAWQVDSLPEPTGKPHMYLYVLFSHLIMSSSL